MSIEPSSKQRGDSFGNLNRANTLPIELCRKILKLVPIRDAVRTSALSRFWRSWRGVLYQKDCVLLFIA
ncbi:hypothetical protein AQUCO_02000480v1 [Aquilegia coerulea]|uniref:F-box domain-containing protein n=1 Tax=Aquilegia coerulea TaxID=218851 RepID=A0A2G5DHS0_AQUCA|nr:hypothetical protein AQUCO_02000480v1 [Aquilegia coerulea]